MVRTAITALHVNMDRAVPAVLSTSGREPGACCIVLRGLQHPHPPLPKGRVRPSGCGLRSTGRPLPTRRRAPPRYCIRQCAFVTGHPRVRTGSRSRTSKTRNVAQARDGPRSLQAFRRRPITHSDTVPPVDSIRHCRRAKPHGSANQGRGRRSVLGSPSKRPKAAA